MKRSPGVFKAWWRQQERNIVKIAFPSQLCSCFTRDQQDTVFVVDLCMTDVIKEEGLQVIASCAEGSGQGH